MAGHPFRASPQLFRLVEVSLGLARRSDGLFDPKKYFDMLQDLAAQAWGIPRSTSWRPLYVVAEKILSGRERLPRNWAVHGTTGYNFLNQINGLFVDPSNGRRMRRIYAKLKLAAGNAIDRLVYGAVADFVRLHLTTASFSVDWYVFNLGDVAIVAGVIGLLYDTLIGSRAAKSP